MDPRQLQGWQADPFGLHEQRYFSGGTPTKLVRDGRVECYDEPPGAPPTDAAVAVSAPSLTVTAVDTSEPAAAYRGPAPVGRATAAYGGLPAPRRRTGLVYATVALVAAAAVVIFVAVEGGFGPTGKSHSASPPLSPAAFVKRSASETLAKQTADVTVQGSFNVAGTAVTLQGNGQQDFAANAWSMNMSMRVASVAMVEDEIVKGNQLYFKLTVNGRSMAPYFDGRPWLELPFAMSASQAAPQDTAGWSLQLLEQQGARVVLEGTQNIGGLSCNEYVVTPTKQGTIAAAEQEWSELGLSASERATALQLLQNSTPPTVTIWLDPQRQLACQLDVYTQLDLASGAGSGSASSTDTEQLLMTFTHYGAPVTITPPPESDIFAPEQGSATAS